VFRQDTLPRRLPDQTGLLRREGAEMLDHLVAIASSEAFMPGLKKQP
jgi:hypothetical protein